MSSPNEAAGAGTWKRQQADRTREHLLETACTLFVEKGYAQAAMEELVARAGLTRGALYHHFRDKRALFEAVLERTLAELEARVALRSRQRTTRHKHHPVRYLAAFEVLLDELSQPATRRILLVEAPAALGREGLHAWLQGNYFRVVRRVVRARSEEGLLPPRLVEPLAHLLIGAIQEAAQVVGEAEDPEKARQGLVEAFRLLTEPFVVER